MGEAGRSYLEGRFVALHGPHVYHPWSRESYYESHYLHCGCKWLIKLISLLARRAYSHIKIHSKGTKNHFWRIFLFQSQYDINTTKWMWTLSVQEFKDENKGTPFWSSIKLQHLKIQRIRLFCFGLWVSPCSDKVLIYVHLQRLMDPTDFQNALQGWRHPGDLLDEPREEWHSFSLKPSMRLLPDILFAPNTN